MTVHPSRWFFHRKWVLVAAGLPVLVALWWAFRPEKLWINARVNEPAPFDSSSAPQPVLTGRFEDATHGASGRATIYKKSGGEEYLRLSDFMAPKEPDVRVLLARGDDPDPGQSVDLGLLKSDQGDQNYDLAAATDLNKYDAVVIYDERSHTVLGLAKLEAF